MAPVAISKSDGNYMYVASDNIHRSTNGGAAWTNTGTGSTNYIEQQRKTAIALAVSPINRDKIYVSTSPIAQNTTNDYLWVNGQSNVFRTTTPSTTPYPSIKGSLPDRFVMDFAISDNNDDSVYVVLGGFGTSHVYLTPNGGTTWISRGTGLPDVPFNAIVIDPVNEGVIYAACDFGVYVSPDRGLSWQDYNTGFWDATLVMDLQISADNKLVAATHGKGVFKGDLFDASTLPVRLIEFGGANAGPNNELHWTVANEQNLSRYELQRSSDGLNYQAVRTVASRNSQSETTYRYNDPVSSVNAEYYYRLKMIDIDGSYTYSAVVFIRKILKNDFSVLGNPFHDVIILKYSIEKAQQMSIGLYSTTGALLKKEHFNATAGTGIFTLYGLANHPAGTYLLKLDSQNEVKTFRVLKQ